MSRRPINISNNLTKLAFVLLIVFMLTVWAAGGASRADVLGQVVVRTIAWLTLIAIIMFLPRPVWRPVSPIAILLGASIALVSTQLIPLPPAVWTHLPGREVIVQSAIASDQLQPWRPISISPGATVNALFSLIVPTVALLLLTFFDDRNHKRVLVILLGFITASSMIGALQFAGLSIDNPFVNDAPGTVVGTFANRNHFALFLALGCVLAPAWVFSDKTVSLWKALLAVMLVTVFALVILATGSRLGVVLGFTGVVLGILSVGGRIKEFVNTFPRRIWISSIVVAIVFLAIAVTSSIMLGRAVSMDRVFALDASEDLRMNGLPIIWQATLIHFPIGAGFGIFDPLFRIYEPDYLLGPSYWNHAHNDWIEIVLEGGAAGLLILAVSFVWWAAASFRAWLTPFSEQTIRARAGSIMILLIGIASMADYPARTPIIMVALVVAGVWLATNGATTRRQNSSSARSKAI